VPAHALREEMFSDDGALAFARFLGPAKWLPREGERIEFEHRALADVRAGEPVASTLGARVWELRAGTSWLVDEIAAGSPAENDTEVFALRGLLYDRLGRGEPLPRIDGPSFCRIDGGGQ
jgi:hypothetical protein